MGSAQPTTLPALTRQARKAETRRALIQAAAELFAAQGMERTSLDEIAARVGLTKGAIYANFRNKEELIDATSEVYSQVTTIDFLFDPALSIEERLAAVGRVAADFMPQIQQLNAMLHLEFDLYMQRHPEKAAQERAEERAWHAEEGAKLEAAARKRGERLPLPGAEFNALLQGMVRGIALEWMRDPEAISPAGIARVFELLGRGFEAWSREAGAAVPESVTTEGEQE